MTTDINDPTTQREFYSDAGRRRSGRTPRKFHHKHHNSGMLGGDALLQGIEIQEIHMSRGLLPILGRGSRYRYIIEYRDENRNIFNIQDSRENLYFTDNSALSRNRHTITEDASTNIAIISFPNGGIRQIPEYVLELDTYGEGKDYHVHTPYFDLTRYKAVDYVNENGPPGMFPEVSNSPSYTADIIYNGIIEPFEIRSILYQKNTFLPTDHFPGRPFGFAPDLVEFVIPLYEMTKPSGGWYEDATSNVSDKSIVSGVEVWTAREGFKQLDADYVSETQFYIDSFTDRDSYDAIFLDDEMERVLISMDSTLDEGGLPFQAIDATVGFDAPARDRFGSIVYRDMLR